MNIQSIEPKQMNYMPLIKQMCKIANIKQTVNNLVSWNEVNSSVSPGLLIESLVICILCGRKPLSRIHEFWSNQDYKFILEDESITLDQLNDDAYGRALDKLSQINMQKFVSLICLNMLSAHDLTIENIHFDTTSKSLQGVYDKDSVGDFDINFGHSKDKRPDLKQIKIGAAVQQNGLPIMGELLSGNESDRAWNPEAVKKMNEHFSNFKFKDITYIGDSATVSSYDSFKKLDGIQFISLFPENFSLNKELKEKAFKDANWTDVGIIKKSTNKKDAASYKLCSYEESINDKPYRFIVVHSSALSNKKLKTLDKKITKSKEVLSKEAKKLEKKEFACLKDAQREKTSFEIYVKNQGFKLESTIEEITKTVYSGKGRPKKGDIGKIVTNYIVKSNVGEFDASALEILKQKESTFVLVTSILDEQKYSNLDILKEYKEQYSIERAFRFLKNPVYMGAIYLKKKERIEAIGYVFILVLLIASYLEYRIRQSLEENNEYLEFPKGYKNYRPSINTIFEAMETVLIISINGTRHWPNNTDKRIFQLIKWAGFDPHIYIE